jgi:hypothetical protein
MAAAGWWSYTYWSYIAGTKAERTLFQKLRKQPPLRIVEVGIGSLERACRLIATAQRFAPTETIRYTGIDWFEERRQPLGPLPLIHAYRQLQATGATVRLMPGAPGSVLPQAANALQQTDLLILSGLVSDESLHRAWFYLPRMCQPTTLVVRETRDASGKILGIEPLSMAEIARRAASAAPAQAA